MIILGVGFGLSYTLFAITTKVYQLNILEYIVICLPGLIALAAAVIKVHNVSFTKFILLSLEFAIKPKKRFWNHRAVSNTVNPTLMEQTKVKIKEQITAKNLGNINLTQLSATLDSGGLNLEVNRHEDLDQVKDDDLITQAYFGNKRKEGPVHNMYWRTRDVQKKKLDLLAKLPSVTPHVTPVPISNSQEPPPSNQEGKGEIKNNEISSNDQEMSKQLTQNSPSKKNSHQNTEIKMGPLTLLPKIENKSTLAKPEEKIKIKSVSKLIPKLKKEEFRETLTTKSKNNLRIALNTHQGGFKIFDSKNQCVIEETAQILPLDQKEFIFSYLLPKGEYTLEFNEVQNFLKPKSIKTNLEDRLKSFSGYYRQKNKKINQKLPHSENKIESSDSLVKMESKKKKRNRKKKNIAQPLRTQTQINTLQKTNPNKVTPKKMPSYEVITSLNDLQEGKEIEFNLD